MAQLWEILRAWWLELVFWKWLRPLLWLLKRSPLRHSLCKEELKRSGYPNFVTSSFVDCAANGLLDKVKLFLDAGITVNGGGRDMDSALIAAARQGNHAIVRLLLDQPTIEVNAKNQSGDTALIEASRAGHREVAEALVRATGIDLNARNNNDESAWIAAIRSSRGSDIEKLFNDRKADHRGVEKERLRIELGDRFTEDVFVDCCGRAETEQVRKFLAAGMVVNARNRRGEPALIAAARQGKIDLLELLLAQEKLDVNESANNGDLPLIVASREGLSKVVERLLKHPKILVNLPASGGDTALIVAARHGREEVVRRLLEQPEVDVNARNQAGESALLEAARRGFDTIASLLVSYRGKSHEAPSQKAPRYVDENVQFTVHRPNVVRPNEWYPLLAFAHLSELRPGQKGAAPPQRVDDTAKQILGDRTVDYSRGTLDSVAPVPREREIIFFPSIPGIEFKPQSHTFLWVGDIHTEEFHLRASPSMDGQVLRGRMSVFLGSIVLADVPLSIRVDSAHQVETDEPEPVTARSYRKIFASYSHKDLDIVQEIDWYARSLGDRYLRDSTDLRAGEVWSNRLKKMIEEADIFQLFWSWNAMSSTYVQEEWKHALSLHRPDFVRPTYWEEPLPKSADGSLPPAELLRLHFERIPRVAWKQSAAADEETHAVESPLLEAARRGHNQTVELLGDRGAQEPDLERKVARWQLERENLFTDTEMLSSVRAQDLARLRKLLVAGMPPDRARDENENTPLLLACEQDNETLVRLLLEYRPDVNARNGHGDTALLIAARHGREATVKLVLERGAGVQARNAVGESPLLEAARRKFDTIVKLLVDRGAEEPDLKSKVARWQLERENLFTDTEMLSSVRAQDLARLRKLLVAGMPPDRARDENENTPLLLACEQDNETLVRLLLEYRPDVNARNRHGDTALLIAARHGREATVKLLLERRAGVQARNQADESPLLEAARRKFDAIVKPLADHGAQEPDLEAKVTRWQLEQDSLFTDAEMLRSTRAQDVDLVRKLLVAGMPPDRARDEDQSTPLLLAAEMDDEAIVRLLLEFGATVDARNRQGDTALLVAARHGREPMVKVLLESGADVQLRNKAGESALLEAARREFQAIIEMLEDKGAEEPDLDRKVTRWQLEQDSLFTDAEMLRSTRAQDIDLVRKLLLAGMPPDRARDEDQSTPLLLAAEMDDEAIVRLLLEFGATVDARNRQGDTALLVAARHGREPTVKVLLESGADVQLRNKAGDSALLEAARREFQAIIEMLEDKGAEEPDLEQKVARWQLERDKAWADSLFVLAASFGDCDKVKQYLRAKKDVNALDKQRQTALIAAAGNNKSEMVRLLLDQPGIALNSHDQYGQTAAGVAASEGYEEIVNLLVAAGAGVPDARKVASQRIEKKGLFLSPAVFVSLAKQGDEEVVSLFLTAGMPANAEDEYGRMALIESARAGQTSVVKLLLDKGADPELRDRLQLSAREVAERNGHLDIARMLETKGAKPSGRSENQLLEGIERGDLEAVQAALASGVSPNICSDEGIPALMEAVLGERPDIVAEMLEVGANTGDRDREGKTCLMRTAESGQVGIMRLLLGKKAIGLDEVDFEGRTALILAAWEGQAEVVKVLIEAGADPLIRDHKGRTALIAAKTKGHTEVAKILEGQGGAQDLDQASLLLAAALGDDQRVAELLEGGLTIDLEVPDEGGNTALALAAARGWTRTLEALMNAGARLDAANSKKDTPLMHAARAGQITAIRMLLDRDGCSLANPVNTNGETALFQAAVSGRGEVVALLAGYTDRPDRGAGGRTPLIEMCYQGDPVAVKALIESGAKVNQQQVKFGKSPLMAALLARHTKVVKILKENGAWAGEAEAELFLKVRSGDDVGLREMNLEKVDLNAMDRSGWTALMVSADAGDDGVVKILLDANAEAGQPNTALRIAASKGRTGALALLIGKTRRSLSADTTAMIEAATHGHAEAVRLLVKTTGAEINGLERGKVPLVAAAARGHLQTVKVLLELGANPEHKNKQGITALKAALLHKHEDVASLLVQWGSTSGIKEARLLRAAGELDLQEVERLLASDDAPDIDARDGEGRTALMIACKKGVAAWPVVEVLLRYYGDEGATRAIEETDFELQTPLMFAAMGGSYRIVSKLMGFDPDIYPESKKRRTALMEACKAGSYQSVKRLLDELKAPREGVTREQAAEAFQLAVNHQDKDGKSPLSEALLGMSTEHSQIVRLLTESGAVKGQEQAEFVKALRECDLPTVKRLSGTVDLHTLRDGGKTPLMLAVEKGCLELAEYLIKKGVDVDQPGPSGNTALILAAGKHTPRSSEMVKLLLQYRADKDRTDDNEASALVHAIENGNDAIAQHLIKVGADVDRGDNKRVTPLALAVAKGNSELVRSLLRATPGPDLEVWSDEHRTAQTLAHLRGVKTDLTEDDLPSRGQPLPDNLKSKLTEIEVQLIEAGAREGWDEAELILAIQQNDTVSAKKLMKRADIHTRDLDGNTPLLIACARGNPALAQVLIKQGSSPAVRNAKERTPLIEAAKNRSVQLVDALLKADPNLDLDAQAEDKESALLEAARAGATDVVYRLLDPLGQGFKQRTRGASVQVTNQSGDTPLIEMARHPAADAVRALLGCGANACARTARNRTAIIEAAAAGRLETLEILIEHLENRLARDRRKLDTVMNAVDDQSRTALDWADSGKHGQCVKLLKDHGGKSVNQTNFVVFTAPTGDCYHIHDCYHVAQAKEGGNLTRSQFLKALLAGYKSCRHCHPGQDPIDWTC